MLKGNNTTQCFFGNWTGMTPWCKEGFFIMIIIIIILTIIIIIIVIILIIIMYIPVYCPFPGFIDRGKILLVGNMGLYEYRPYVRWGNWYFDGNHFDDHSMMIGMTTKSWNWSTGIYLSYVVVLPFFLLFCVTLNTFECFKVDLSWIFPI